MPIERLPLDNTHAAASVTQPTSAPDSQHRSRHAATKTPAAAPRSNTAIQTPSAAPSHPPSSPTNFLLQLKHFLPFRLRISWKIRLITFFSLTSIGIWLVFFLVFRLFLDEHVARQRALRDTVAWMPLQQRQERFEIVIAEVIGRESAVNAAVDELHRRVRQLGEAATKESATFAPLAASPASGEGIGWGTLMNQFLFASPPTGRRPGEVDAREDDPAMFGPIRSFPLEEDAVHLTSALDDHRVALRERMAQLLHATSVGIDCQMFVGQSSNMSQVCLSWLERYGEPLSPLSVLLLHDFPSCPITAEERIAKSVSDTSYNDEDDFAISSTRSLRPCFSPFFLPPVGSPVRECAGIAAEEETTSGCKQPKQEISRRPEERLASSVNPPLSSREWSFQLGVRSNIDFLDEKTQTRFGLKWVTAGDLFDPVPLSEHPTEHLLRKMKHSRFVGGPSSHTSSILLLARYLGMSSPGDMSLVRLAMMAYLVPIRENSIFEILVATEDAPLRVDHFASSDLHGNADRPATEETVITTGSRLASAAA